ncbi:MAG: glycosyltransferase [Bacteroidales bacterium]|nr:glycosyltransferase [Bacteroidales bacterium]
MISYIIIGHNEGWKLDLCISSVLRTIKENPYIDGEIIYVDSNSGDNSIEIAKKYLEVRVLRLKGDFNSPVARNTGASVSNGDILFFIDGDMEVESSFLKHVINRDNRLCYGFVGGYYINKVYDSGWKLISTDQFPPAWKLKHDFFEASTGGLFMISRENWDLAGGMKNYYFGGEDPDLAFRLAKKGIYKLRKTNLMGVHHTQNPGRSVQLKSLISKRALSGRILLYRENLNSAPALKRMLRNEYSAIFFALSLLSLFFSISVGGILILFYLLMTALRALRRRSNPLPALLLKDIIFIFGFLFYWPGREMKTIVEEI